MALKDIKPQDLLAGADDLVNKIPESIASIIRKIVYVIFGILLIIAAMFGYKKGSGRAVQEGQQLASDTRALFIEDIERDYNRKRKNIRMSDPDLAMPNLEKQGMNFEFSGRENNNSVVKEESPFMENEKGIRSLKKKGDTAPLLEEGQGYMPAPIDGDLPGVRVPREESIRPVTGKTPLEEGEDILKRDRETKSKLIQNKKEERSVDRPNETKKDEYRKSPDLEKDQGLLENNSTKTKKKEKRKLYSPKGE